MRILFVTEDLANGGSERVISVLANGASKEHTTAVVAIRRDKVVYNLDPGVTYYPFLDEDSNKLRRTFGRIGLLKKAIHEFHPDIVVAFDVVPIIYASFVCSITHTKLVVSERADPQKHKEQALTGKVYFAAFKKANGVVFQTEDAKRFFDESVQKKSIVIPNPINDAFIRARYQGSREKEIVTVCRLTNQKNLRLFIDIVEQIVHNHPEYRGVIYGDGPEAENLKQYAEEKHASNVIHFAGHVDNVASTISRSRFYLCTSDFEGISNSMLEAMALGLTVISTDCPVGGARMAITSGIDGMLFPVGDKQAAVSILNELIDNPERAENLGKAATEISDRWGKEKILRIWLDYLAAI